MGPEELRVRWGWGLACAAAVTLPFLTTRWLPVTDLPQHLAQIPLFWDALGNPTSAYRIQWGTPYGLVYLLVGACWSLFGPERAGQATMLGLALAWVAAVHGLAAHYRRPVAAAILASTLFFSSPTYWGFLAFIAGAIVFMGWVLLCDARPRGRGVEIARFFACAGLLYASHVLWLAVGLGWLVVRHVRTPQGREALRPRAVAVAPWLLLALVWYPSLSAGGFESQALWRVAPLARLSPTWLAEAAYGGLRGPLEYVMALAIAGWAAVALWRGREGVQVSLLGAAGMLFLLSLLLPTSYQNTIVMAGRWIPTAAALALLALPPVPIRFPTQRALALSLVGAFALCTSLAWLNFETELSGLEPAIAALPPHQRVIGLTHLRQSEFVRNEPYLQLYAYAQVDRAARLNFSFAEFAPLPVVYRDLETLDVPWTRGLEWYPEAVRRSDLDHFDYALVAGDEEVHARYAALERTQPVTGPGTYRLYRIVPDTEPAEQAGG